MGDADELVDAALQQAVALPSSHAFRAWCRAYRAGQSDEAGVKRAFRSVFSGLAAGRFDDFTRQLANAEARVKTLRAEQLIGWVQAAAARAALELMYSRWEQSVDAAQAQRTKAIDIAAAALRFAQRAGRGSRPAFGGSYDPQ